MFGMSSRSLYGRDQSHFARAPQANIPRSTFDRSHGYKTTFYEGYLIPVFVDEALPGDTFNLRMTCFGRLATPVFPIMDNMYLETFFFAIPYRLVWNNWERFNGAQDNPDDSTDYLVPTMEAPASTGYAVGSLSDYFGIPTGVDGFSHVSLWHRAYNLLWNQWFRDENLQDSVPVDLDDGPDNPADYVLLRRGKRKDYFTSCLPWPQKGPEVELPLGSTAPVELTGVTPYSATYIRRISDGTAEANETQFTTDGTGRFQTQPYAGSVLYDPGTTLQADLSDATASNINALREAFQIQRLYERDARGGTRYTEIVRSHFGVVSPDARLQRAEFLGGGKSPVVVSPIPQTSSTDGTSPQGNLAAYGTVVGHGHGFVKSFTEHCLVIGLVCVRADLNYQQGLNRMWSRSTRFDFYWPALSHLGEQAVLNKEIYLQGTAADDEVFGYQERFAEYRYKPSLVTGLFRSSASGTLDSWHLAQEFSALPVLNDEFIVEDAPMDRVKAVTTQPDFIFDSVFKFKCARPMPVYSVPGLIDHF